MISSQLRGVARQSLKGRWGTAIAVTLIASLLGGSSFGSISNYSSSASSAGSNGAANENVKNLIANLDPTGQAILTAITGVLVVMGIITLLYLLMVLIVGGAVNLGLKQFNITLVRKDAPANFGLLFSRFNIFGKALLLQVVTFVFIFLWTLLLVIPGIIATYRYAMAPYLMAQNPKMGVMEALNVSKQMMKGQKWNLFCLHFSFIGWMLLGVLSCGIGMLWVNPYMGAAEAAFYLNLSSQLTQNGQAAAPQPHTPASSGPV